MSGKAYENVASEDTNCVESVKMLTELAANYAEYMQTNCLKEVFLLHVNIVNYRDHCDVNVNVNVNVNKQYFCPRKLIDKSMTTALACKPF